MGSIDVQELTVRLDSSIIVDRATFGVEPGEVVALLGPNGAGKTTTIETIEGYHKPTSGSVRILGLDPHRDRSTLANRWGVMPQSGGLPMGLTVSEAVELFAGLHGSELNTASLLRTCGLADKAKRRWRRMSGGEQQRLSLALALCGGHDVMLLDEPTAALDGEGRQAVLDLIRTRASEGSAVLLTTHRFDDVEQVADRVVVLHHGRVVTSGSVAELTTGQPHVRFVTEAGLDVGSLATELQAPVTEIEAGTYQIDCEPSPPVAQALTNWLARQSLVPRSIESGTRSLEELINELTRDAP